MSLINEALKRARQAPVRPLATASDPVLQPAPSLPSRVTQLLPLAGGALLLVSFWFLILWWRHAPDSRPGAAGVRQTASALAAPLDKAAATVAQVAAQRAADAEVQPSSGAPAAAVSHRTDNPAAAPVSKPAQSTAPARPQAGGTSPREERPVTQVASAPDPTPVTFQLQGIFYRRTRASALIDGETVFVGDEIQGVKVVSIDRTSVRLLRRGQTIVLKLR